MWRLSSSRRLSEPCKKVPVQILPHVWTLYQPLLPEKASSFQVQKAKVHQLQTGAVYAKESAICSQSEDDSSSKDSFCLQVKVKYTQANLQRIPRPTHLITNLAYRLITPYKKLVSKSNTRHLCGCQHYAFGSHIYTFSSVPLMYSLFGRHISFFLIDANKF